VVIDDGNASSFGVTFDSTNTVETARFALPVPNVDPATQAGTWYAVLEIDDDFRRRVIGGVDRAPTGNQSSMSDLRNKGARYCLSAHAFSNLRMQVSVGQDGFVPGSKIFLRTTLTEYSLPVAHRARVWAGVELPDGSRTRIVLSEVEPGIFEASLPADIPGIYRCLVNAEGATYRGAPFTREQLATAAVWSGAHRPPPPIGGRRADCCGLLDCLLGNEKLFRQVGERLRREGIDLDLVRECLEAYRRTAPR